MKRPSVIMDETVVVLFPTRNNKDFATALVVLLSGFFSMATVAARVSAVKEHFGKHYSLNHFVSKM